MIQYKELEIPGVWLLTPQVFGDERGSFTEVLRFPEFAEKVSLCPFIQENESFSTRGVLRGLHLQHGSAAQAKLVRCIHGEVIDVAVDLRLQSPTFGRHVAVRLSGTTKQQLYIPRGFAHGYLVVSDEAIFSYKVDNGYSPQDECHLYPFDPEIGVDWLQYGVPREQLILSPKDLEGSSLQQYLRG